MKSSVSNLDWLHLDPFVIHGDITSKSILLERLCQGDFFSFQNCHTMITSSITDPISNCTSARRIWQIRTRRNILTKSSKMIMVTFYRTYTLYHFIHQARSHQACDGNIIYPFQDEIIRESANVTSRTRRSDARLVIDSLSLACDFFTCEKWIEWKTTLVRQLMAIHNGWTAIIYMWRCE